MERSTVQSCLAAPFFSMKSALSRSVEPGALAPAGRTKREVACKGVQNPCSLFARCSYANSTARAGLDHENRKTPISKPPANAQGPNVQAETTRTRIRRSAFSWDRSVIAAAPPSQHCWGVPYRRAGFPATRPLVKPTPRFGPGQSRLRHWCHAVRWPAHRAGFFVCV
jgi:hypothetical protein